MVELWKPLEESIVREGWSSGESLQWIHQKETDLSEINAVVSGAQ